MSAQMDLIPAVLTWRSMTFVRDDHAECEVYETALSEGWFWMVSETESGRYLASANLGPGRFDVVGKTKEEALEKCRDMAIKRFRGLLEQLEGT